MDRINPLLTPSQAPFGAPAFDKITIEDYLPAFKVGIEETMAEVDKIVANTDAPTFENTIEALEYSGETLSTVEGIFFNVLEAESDEKMQALAEEVSPMLSDLSMYISQNDGLFQRVKALYDKRDSLCLDKDQMRLLEKTYKNFEMSGAALPEDKKKQYAEYCKQANLLSLKFSNNVLAATHAWTLHLTDEADLAGLPDYVKEMGASSAKEKGLDGWLFTLDRPSYGPFMKYSTRRDLREKMYREFGKRAVGGEFDNTDVIRQIIDLRIKSVNLQGYSCYSDFALERRMAKTTPTVLSFIDKLMAPSLPKARAEVADILAYAKKNGFEDEQLMPWDFTFWSERLQEAEYSLNEEILKPYFQLDKVIDAVFDLANRLYGITFEERKDIPVYHKDVKVYDVKDENGEHLSLFYADFFPRETKRGGAWMTEFMGQYQKDGKDYRPFISIVTNFTKPTESTPSLLTHDEVVTFLHEFGHSLHGMLSKGKYPSLCGTNVARDFVELPSQIMENWAFEPEYLNTFARHYKTGETIPSDLIDKIVAAKNYLAAYLQVRQLQFGVIDMAWHTLTSLPEEGAVEFEKKILAPYATLPPVEGCATCPSFGHIFSGGYSAGYYSYKWAEVLEADGFSLFQEKGIFSHEASDKFRKEILERGSSEPEDVLYRNFRGHDPQPEALLVKLGIISK
ncbi:MAG: M3 family metallopeptidase [Bacteroidales bacterium]|nr:M3 family metallopeptidase [Bacteroidales bacterium]